MSLESVEEKIRSAPLPSAGIVFVAGLVLSRVPLLGILAFFLRLVVTLIRPALLVFGLAKLIQWANQKLQESTTPELPSN